MPAFLPNVGKIQPDGRPDNVDYACLVELGGFHVSGPSTLNALTQRYGPGDYRVTACAVDPSAVRWEVLVERLRA